jgi:hypothetical protein
MDDDVVFGPGVACDQGSPPGICCYVIGSQQRNIDPEITKCRSLGEGGAWYCSQQQVEVGTVVGASPGCLDPLDDDIVWSEL